MAYILRIWGNPGAHVYEGKLCILAVMPILENYEQQIPYGTVTMGHVLDLEYFNTVMFQNITSISILNDEPSPGGASVYPLNAGEMGLKFALDRADGGMPLDVRLNTPRIFMRRAKKRCMEFRFSLLQQWQYQSHYYI